MLVKRLLTAIIGIPLTILIIWNGGSLFLAAITIIVLLALREMINMLCKDNIYPLKFLTYIYGVTLIIQTYIYKDNYLMLLFFIYFLLLSFIIVFQKIKFESIVYSLFIVFYVPFLIRYLVLLRMQPQGFLFILTVFILTWTSDTGAFFIGKRFGKNKLSPSISPNKTVEGAIGGIFFSAVAAIILASLFLNINTFYAVILGIIISISGQIGDLFESFIKRQIGVKDSGDILPGHGGILDRFDSLMFTGPTFYYIFKLFVI
ncbi:MAG: phosphatidate cytidylyltransferase [Clostridia bacterium]|nr:phosphatidate cytidylyltransferase [Clostridia bacterium]